MESDVSRLTDENTERVHAHWRDRLQEVLRQQAWRQERRDGPRPCRWTKTAGPRTDEPEWTRLARIRALHAKVGTNRASVPKPPSG